MLRLGRSIFIPGDAGESAQNYTLLYNISSKILHAMLRTADFPARSGAVYKVAVKAKGLRCQMQISYLLCFAPVHVYIREHQCHKSENVTVVVNSYLSQNFGNLRPLSASVESIS